MNHFNLLSLIYFDLMQIIWSKYFDYYENFQCQNQNLDIDFR